MKIADIEKETYELNISKSMVPSHPTISDIDLKIALFGVEDDHISDEMLQMVKIYALFIKNR